MTLAAKPIQRICHLKASQKNGVWKAELPMVNSAKNKVRNGSKTQAATPTASGHAAIFQGALGRRISAPFCSRAKRRKRMFPLANSLRTAPGGIGGRAFAPEKGALILEFQRLKK